MTTAATTRARRRTAATAATSATSGNALPPPSDAALGAGVAATGLGAPTDELAETAAGGTPAAPAAALRKDPSRGATVTVPAVELLPTDALLPRLAISAESGAERTALPVTDTAQASTRETSITVVKDPSVAARLRPCLAPPSSLALVSVTIGGSGRSARDAERAAQPADCTCVLTGSPAATTTATEPLATLVTTTSERGMPR